MHQVIRTGNLDTLLQRESIRLAVIEGPSGSGKSTLLLQLSDALAQRGRYTVVLKATREDDAASLVRRLLEGFGACTRTIEGAGLDETLDALTDRFVQGLRERAEPAYVLIDDFQKVKSPATIQLITRLLYLDPAPPLTLVIASRVTPGIPDAALRLAGHMVELGPERLKFSESEAEALRALEAGSISAAAWRDFNCKVNGWAVALRLALILVREGKLDLAGLLGFSGKQREMAGYLSQLIVEGIAPADQRLLLTAAAFDTLRPDVVRAALGPDAAQRLLHLLQQLAPPMDGDAVAGDTRLHSVVARYFEAQAEIEGVDLIEPRRRAALYFEGRREWRKATRYALRSGDLPFTAGIVERGGGWRLVYRGEEGTLQQFGELMALPPAQYASFPRTVLGLAVSAAKRGEIEVALHLVRIVGAMIDGGDGELAAEFRLIQALMNLYADSPTPTGSIAALEADIADIETVDPVRLALTQNLLCFFSLQSGLFEPAIRFGRLSIATFRTAQSDFGAAHLPLHIGQAEFLSGQIENAHATLSEHLEQCERELGPTADLTLMTRALLTEVYLESGNRPADSTGLADVFEQLGNRDSWYDPLASLVVSRMRIALIDGADADAVLRGAESIARRRNYRRLFRLVALLRIEMLLRIGQDLEAERLVELARTSGAEAGLDATNLRGLPLAALEARLLLNRGRPEAALLKLDEAETETGGNVHRQIRLALFRVRILLALGDAAGAKSRLERLSLSQQVDLYCLPFAEEGSAFASFVLHQVRQLHPQSLVHRRLAPGAMLIESLELDRSRADATDGDIVQLTHSEAEVLLRLERGLPNKQIARELGISVNTIKYHLANIYRKLNVSTRTAAINGARQSGLFAAAQRRNEPA